MSHILLIAEEVVTDKSMRNRRLSVDFPCTRVSSSFRFIRTTWTGDRSFKTRLFCQGLQGAQPRPAGIAAARADACQGGCQAFV